MMRKSMISAVSAALLLLPSCQMEEPRNTGEGASVNVNVIAECIESRTSAVTDGTNTWVVWQDSDEIDLVEIVDGEVNCTATSSDIEISDNGRKACFSVSLDGSANDGALAYTALYPAGYFEEDDGTNWFFSIPDVQSLDNGNFASDADILIGESIERNARVKDGEELSFRFKRAGSTLKLTLKGIPQGEIISRISIQAPVAIVGGGCFDLLTGEVSDFFGSGNTLTMETSVTATGNDTFWARTIPGTWPAGSQVKVEVTGKDCIYQKTATLPSDFQFADGGLTALSVGSLQAIAPELVVLDKSLVNSNYPMEYVSEAQGSNEYGLGGTPDWFLNLSGSAANARRDRYGKPENMWDGNDQTCFHTNLDWGQPNSSWGARAPYGTPGTVSNHYIEVGLPQSSDAIKIYIKNCADGRALGDAGFQLFTKSATGSYTKRAVYKNSGFGAEISINGITDAKGISAIRITNNANPANDWTGTDTAFGIAELKVWSYGTMGDPSRVSSISLNKTELDLSMEDGAQTLVATILPSTATNKAITWTSSDPSVATVNGSGVVTPVSIGIATITATTSDGGRTATCKVYVSEWDGDYPKGVTVTKTSYGYYAHIDFNANPRLVFTPLYSAYPSGSAKQLSTYFADFDKSKGTPIIMTNGGLFWTNPWAENTIQPCDLVIVDGVMKQTACNEDNGYFPVRSAIGAFKKGGKQNFEIAWVRCVSYGGSLYKYPAPQRYTSNPDPASSGATSWFPDCAIACGPRLVHNGQNIGADYYSLECMSFSGGATGSTKRTAVGLKEDGSMIIMVCSTSITLTTLGDELIKLGCTEALNFDGGGSSEMIGPGGNIIVKQSDASERKMPSAICIYESK